jgi:AcrR family transcriptional regulator
MAATRKRSARPRPAPRADEVRARLLAAALDIARAQGGGAVTSVALARAAGLAQSGFYRYFPTVEACLDEALAQVTTGFRDDVARRRRAWFELRSQDPALAYRHHLENLSFSAEHPDLAELAVRRRHEATVVGQAMRELNEALCADLEADLHRYAGPPAGGPALDPVRVRAAARLVVESAWNAVDQLLAGTPAEILAGMLAALAAAISQAEHLARR